MNKLNEDRNKAYTHITDEVESFIYQKGIINDYSIETMQDVDCDYSKVDEKLTITIYMSRDL
ncbi:hypothetical protein [Mammaliicoccus sciuri]|uniref:hypothetical protein n=1 Tax=Mammaliicoccus sciuri TaxID=1296 RepID=UPI002DB79E20|nr:hypothetical protein [Mammaliicoccus sciuri]MEB6233827.1 hypothetical protein [Mammaliicoccus sciuri]